MTASLLPGRARAPECERAKHWFCPCVWARFLCALTPSPRHAARLPCRPEAAGHGPRLQGRSHADMRSHAAAPAAPLRASLGARCAGAAQHAAIAPSAQRPYSDPPPAAAAASASASPSPSLPASATAACFREPPAAAACCLRGLDAAAAPFLFCCCCAPRADALEAAGAGGAPPGGVCLLSSFRAMFRRMACSVAFSAARRLGRQKPSFSAHLTARLYTCDGRHTARVRALRGAAVESEQRRTS